jgi:Xaa-Pro aminopeptidase
MSVGARLQAVRRVFQDSKFDAVLITNPANRRYLTGFSAEDHAPDESSGMVVLTPREATLFVSPTNLRWARAEVDRATITVEEHSGNISQTLADWMRAAGVTAVAVEDATTPAAVWFALQSALGDRTEMVRAGALIDGFRSIKAPDELQSLREAARLTDKAFAIARRKLKAGMTEREAADSVADALRVVGSEGEAFATIVASGPNAARPHHLPGERQLAPGEPIIIDMGARVNGYNGDLTRTICLGRPNEGLVSMYAVVLESQAAGLDAVFAGAPVASADLATREVFARHGLEQHVVHSAGHGLGLRVHEAPSVRASSDEMLETGNVITMEPGLYVEGWGGVRIEDVVIVRDAGHDNITAAPKAIGVRAL